ncbi:MAG: UDP-glucose 4-epimerase GalE [Bacteroidales bacterium]|jgi:UDP-glucose 4-epimerase
MNEVVLVTGGSGYIGSHTTVELIQAGYNVIIIDNLSNSEKSVIDGIKKITGKDVIFEKVDCCDKESLEKIFNKYSFNSIIHFAANKAVGESVKEPLIYYSNNIESLINILGMMRKYNVENIVFSSSCTVYGQPEILPATEETPRNPAMSPYGNTKQICEDILRDSISAYQNIKGIALRYFNPIGAHPSALIGELPRGIPNNLIPFITQTAAGIRPTLNVFGDDYNTPDGTCIRDYINVVDLAKAHVVAVNRMIKNGCKKNYEVFNIGTGHGVSTLEIVKAFEKANNIKLNYKIVERRSGDIEAVWADPTFANKELGWKAEKTLEETLVSAWSWEKHLRNI